MMRFRSESPESHKGAGCLTLLAMPTLVVLALVLIAVVGIVFALVRQWIQ
jgi:hypothetical protein